jgi:hypothetical protein
VAGGFKSRWPPHFRLRHLVHFDQGDPGRIADPRKVHRVGACRKVNNKSAVRATPGLAQRRRPTLPRLYLGRVGARAPARVLAALSISLFLRQCQKRAGMTVRRNLIVKPVVSFLLEIPKDINAGNLFASGRYAPHYFCIGRKIG